VDKLGSVVKGGFCYFAVVFAAGFVLGTVRTLLVVPRLGTRTAELLEMPVMLLVSVVAARWAVQRFRVRAGWLTRLSMGLIALALLVATEFSFVLWIRGLSLGDYLAGRDPVSGNAYLATLAIFALMPLLLRRASL
jgi:hypothetical protein